MSVGEWPVARVGERSAGLRLGCPEPGRCHGPGGLPGLGGRLEQCCPAASVSRRPASPVSAIMPLGALRTGPKGSTSVRG